HHIISDGVSEGILNREFFQLNKGEELGPLKLRYRDYSQWQDRMSDSGPLKQQEAYWLQHFQGQIPVLDLPLNYPRPQEQEFAGDIVAGRLGKEKTRLLNQVLKETDTTLFILLLTAYYVLLHKYTGQEDIIIGSIVAGRNHVDLENIVGLFVKTLGIRNYPAADKTFDDFLQEVKENTLMAFENQQYPFSRLLEILDLSKDRSRNPLFDAAFILRKIDRDPAQPGETGKLTPNTPGYINKTAKFDLTFEAFDVFDKDDKENDMIFTFQYRS
ncbi:MAG: hypothetical protein GY940_17240, partial [bacterium]|nr:hypothetical protein [bacterium]